MTNPPRPASLPLALTAALLGQTFTSAAIFAPAVLAPAASVDVGVPASFVGLMTALIYLSAAFAAPQIGGRVPQWGALRVTQIGLVVAALGLALATLAHPWVVLIAALVIGVGYGPSTPSGSALLAGRTPPEIFNFVMSIRQTGIPAGGALAGFALPWLIITLGWRNATLIAAASCIVVALLLQTVRSRFDAPVPLAAGVKRPSLKDALNLVLTHTALRRISITAYFYGGVQLSYASFLVVLLVEQADMSVVRAGAVLSAGMAAGMLGRLVWGAAADALGDARKVLIGIGVIAAACAALMTQVSAAWSYAGVMLLAIVFGATTLGWNGVYIAELAREAPPGKVALATGASLMFGYGGAVTVPPVCALLRHVSGGYVWPFLLLTLLSVAGVWSLRRRG